jgi:hypothetical protein
VDVSLREDLEAWPQNPGLTSCTPKLISSR